MFSRCVAWAFLGVAAVAGCVADGESDGDGAGATGGDIATAEQQLQQFNCERACTDAYAHTRQFCANSDSVPPEHQTNCLISARGGLVLCSRAPGEQGCQKACFLGYTRFSAFCGNLPDKKKREHCRSTASEALAICVNRGSTGIHN